MPRLATVLSVIVGAALVGLVWTAQLLTPAQAATETYKAFLQLLVIAAVGHVVLNRVAAQRWWGRTPEDVCLKAWQFSCWNVNDPNRPKLVAVTHADALFQLALQLSQDLLGRSETARQLDDPTQGATHYHADPLPLPAWARAPGATECARIGHHIFYRNIA